MLMHQTWSEVAQWRDLLVDTYAFDDEVVFGRKLEGRHLICPLKTGERKLILKAVSAEPGLLEKMHGELVFQNYVYQHGGPAPYSLFHNKCENQFIVKHPLGALGALHGFLSGRPCLADVDDARSIGQALARMHTIAGNFNLIAEPAIGDSDYFITEPVQRIENLLGSLPLSIKTLVRQLHSWLECLPQEVAEYGICHGDSHYENAVISRSGVACYYDFEHWVKTWRAYDLATFIWGTFRLTEGAAVWNSFIQGYASVRPISAREADWIRPFLVIRQIWWLGFNLRVAQHHTRVMHLLVEEGVAFIEKLADETDVYAILHEGVR